MNTEQVIWKGTMRKKKTICSKFEMLILKCYQCSLLIRLHRITYVDNSKPLLLDVSASCLVVLWEDMDSSD